jgi:hypothetical protein
MPCACADGKALAAKASDMPSCAARGASGIGGLPAIASRTTATCCGEAQDGAAEAPWAGPGTAKAIAARYPSAAVLDAFSDIMGTP